MINDFSPVEISTFFDHIIDISHQKKLPKSEVMKRIYNIGIRSIDINSKYLDNDFKEINDALQESKLKIGCICHECEVDDPNKLEMAYKNVDRASELGVDKLMIIPGFVVNSEKKEAIIDNMINYVNNVCEYANQENVTICMEVYDDSRSPLSGEGLLEFGKRCQKLSYVFDTGNNAFWNEDALEFYEYIKDRIVHVHLKDRAYIQNNNEWAIRSINNQELYPCAVGTGEMNISKIIDKLVEDNYSGGFSIEHYGANDMWKYLDDSVKWLKNKMINSCV